MARFLHVADVHLGFDRYDKPERTKDFFFAFRDLLERHALTPQVDFVLIAGDLFEHRHILPAVLNQAQICLTLLQKAGIPVLAIEGNHDHRPYGTRTSWLRYLADWGLLVLLEPEEDQDPEVPIYQPWSFETRRGGYIDLPCGVRVVGSRWYGATAPQVIPRLAQGIAQLPLGPPHTVMMFHHGLEGQISRYAGALRYENLLPLKQAGVDYLALGHIHKHYTAEGWIFNPGSVEANSIAEGQDQNPRGAYLVNMTPTGIHAELKQDYYQRPLVRLTLTVQPHQTLEAVEQAAIAEIQAAGDQTQGAIVELRLQGQVGFNRLDLDVRQLQAQLEQESKALFVLLKYEVTGTEYRSPSPGGNAPSRLEIEQQVFTDFLAALTQYQDRADTLAQGLIDLKQKVLAQGPEPDLYRFAQELSQDGENPPA